MKNICGILIFSFLMTVVSMCQSSPAVTTYQITPTPEPIINQAVNKQLVEEEGPEDANEIISCSPQKIYKGETFRVKFKKGHGKNFAIYREEGREFYFLSTGDDAEYPQMEQREFEARTSLTMNTGEVRYNTRKEDKEERYISKPFFSKTGWYNIIVGHQALDVDFIDMPVTGMCQIYYIHIERPPGK